jgi:hypothetical protein
MCTEHDWIVYSTSSEEVCLSVQCLRCGQVSIVDHLTPEEWLRSFHAISQPYRWLDASRVKHYPNAPLTEPHVQETASGQLKPSPFWQANLDRFRADWREHLVDCAECAQHVSLIENLAETLTWLQATRMIRETMRILYCDSTGRSQCTDEEALVWLKELGLLHPIEAERVAALHRLTEKFLA